MLTWINKARKAVAGAVGSALTVLGFLNALHLPGHAGVWVGGALAALTPIAVYLVPNKQPGAVA